jgi:hypothetical protein
MPDATSQQGQHEAAVHAEAAPASCAAPAAECPRQAAALAKPASSQDAAAQQECAWQVYTQHGSADQANSAPLPQRLADEMEVDDELVDIGVPAAASPVPPDEGSGAIQLLSRSQWRCLAWDALTTVTGCSRAVPRQIADKVADDLSSIGVLGGVPLGGNGGFAGKARRRIEAVCLQHLAGEGSAGCSRAVSRADVSSMAGVVAPASSIESPQVTLTLSLTANLVLSLTQSPTPSILKLLSNFVTLHGAGTRAALLTIPVVRLMVTQPCASHVAAA